MFRTEFLCARRRRRFSADSGLFMRATNLVRGHYSSKRLDYLRRIGGLLESNPQMRLFFEGRSAVLPKFYVRSIRQAMGPLWEAVPPGATAHDHLAYRKNPAAFSVVNKSVRVRPQRALVA